MGIQTVKYGKSEILPIACLGIHSMGRWIYIYNIHYIQKQNERKKSFPSYKLNVLCTVLGQGTMWERRPPAWKIHYLTKQKLLEQRAWACLYSYWGWDYLRQSLNSKKVKKLSLWDFIWPLNCYSNKQDYKTDVFSVGSFEDIWKIKSTDFSLRLFWDMQKWAFFENQLVL